MTRRLVLGLVLFALPAAAQSLEVVGRYDSGAGRGTEIVSVQAKSDRAVVLVGGVTVYRFHPSDL
ncbi:MAG: hypothetical protein ACYTGZ_18670 [Planctomycetota bacterium]